jgi:hypothetical protein
MSHAKFAPVTSSLLVRKGEAQPSPMTPSPITPASGVPQNPAAADTKASTAQMTRAVSWLSDAQKHAAPEAEGPRFIYKPEPPPHIGSEGSDKSDNEKPRRIVLTLSPHDYETLGLVAVKKGSTRHDLAQAAMDAYFEWLVAEYGEACNCIAGGALCRCECGN